MQSLDVTYSPPARERLLEALRSRFLVEVVDQARRRVAYFDTFDWRLHREGGCLRLATERSGPMLSWQHRNGALRHRLPTRIVPAFARDFPAGDFRRELEPMIAMRRLMSIVELQVSGFIVNILDRREKTVARLRFEEVIATGPNDSAESVALAPVLRIQPIRGFDRAYRRLVRFLESDLDLDRVVGSELEQALSAIGRRANDYSSKVAIELDLKMLAAPAVKAIHKALLGAIRRNESGTRQDLDSEFLHDFRVAIRRTRSALSQFKGVFAKRDSRRFKAEFAWLGSLTGPTRDLDVYLLKMDSYEAELADSVRRDLAPLRAYLVAEQRRSQRRMVRHLDSPRYRALLESWQAFLEQPADLERASNAARPIVQVACEWIWKVYSRVLEEGLAIDDETPAEALHELRIRCKKLRYLMEFFRSLYDSRKIERLIKALKQLQDNLGDFNDYEVQQMSLKTFAEDMQRRAVAPAATLMAMGRLVEHLEAGQERERHRFAARFAKFSLPENQRLAKDLFAPA